jgi:hypothetical protein
MSLHNPRHPSWCFLFTITQITHHDWEQPNSVRPCCLCGRRFCKTHATQVADGPSIGICVLHQDTNPGPATAFSMEKSSLKQDQQKDMEVEPQSQASTITNQPQTTGLQPGPPNRSSSNEDNGNHVGHSKSKKRHMYWILLSRLHRRKRLDLARDQLPQRKIQRRKAVAFTKMLSCIAFNQHVVSTENTKTVPTRRSRERGIHESSASYHDMARMCPRSQLPTTAVTKYLES